MNEDDPRVKLIREVQKLGCQWDASAQAESVKAVRGFGKKEDIQTAREWVIKSDTANQMANKVITLINAYWPRNPPKSTE